MNNITIFTPTYNRTHTLERLYKSLLVQKGMKFSWLIIDDGSTDNTEQLVKQFINEKKIDIKYLKTKNGGKHRAINKALDIVDTKYFFIVDSDDFLTDDALLKINNWQGSIKDEKICGVVGLKGYNSKNIVGKTFKGNYKELAIIDRKKEKIFGDKAEIFITEILNKYRFSEYEGENFITEATLWNQMALDGYKMAYYNDIIYICDYLEDGLSKSINKKFKDNPKGFLEYTLQMNGIYQYNIFQKIKNISFYGCILKEKYTIKEISKNLNVLPIFVWMCITIRRILNKD